eukprot:COSAG01_NODE_64572_length_276_cov_0.581921_1_plen_46_part_10
MADEHTRMKSNRFQLSWKYSAGPKPTIFNIASTKKVRLNAAFSVRL